MKKTNTNKGLKKLIPAAGMLMLSAAMLGTSTFAWFTMNKEVSVTGMEVKAHAEEGLLINEVKAHASQFWDDAAMAGNNVIALRPTSTSDLTKWWHANSKMSYEEAGIGDLSGTVNVDASGNKYIDVSANATGITDYTVVYDAAGPWPAVSFLYSRLMVLTFKVARSPSASLPDLYKGLRDSIYEILI